MWKRTDIPVWAVCALLCCGCSKDNVLEETRQGNLARVVFTIDTPKPYTGSVRTPNESTIDNLNVFFYDSSGQLVEQAYFTGARQYEVMIQPDKGYTICGIANAGDLSALDPERVASLQKYELLSTDRLTYWQAPMGASALLMSGKVTGVDVEIGDDKTVVLPMSRLVAKVHIDVEAVDPQITITKYELWNLPARSYFAEHPLPSEAFEDDFAAGCIVAGQDVCVERQPDDWLLGNDGTTDGRTIKIGFYMYENRQGVRPEVTVQQDKKASDVMSGRATYLYIRGTAPGYKWYSWRIYLGANNTNNFNIKRNCEYTLSIKLAINENDARTDWEHNER